MEICIYQTADWPKFQWNLAALADQLAAVRNRQGQLLGKMSAVGFRLREDVTLETLTEDVQKSSEIEGERLDRQQVRSSIARRLGMDTVPLLPADRDVEGVVEMMLDATRQFDAPLTSERLFGWHASLFPTGRSGLYRIIAGGWRDDSKGPMQVVSGPIGLERVHYEAPPAAHIESEMESFLKWFNAPDGYDPVIKAALSHLWFVIIHPFDDGNGRIARAIADMALARSENSSQRFYSMSAQTQKERSVYYKILEKTTTGDLDITLWIKWFLGCLDRAIQEADKVIDTVLNKTHWWDKLSAVSINERQRIMLNKLTEGFTGNLTTAKWANMTQCSHDTALRDIQDLIDKDVLSVNEAGGRSTHYSLRAG